MSLICTLQKKPQLGTEAGKLGFQGHVPLHGKFKATLGSVKPCLKNPKRPTWDKVPTDNHPQGPDT